MLREMGVRVWQPMVRPVAEPASDVAAPAGFAIPAVETAMPAILVATPAAATPAARAHAPEPVTPRTIPAPSVAPTLASGLQPRPAGIERMDWAELQTAVAGCRACSLCESRRNTVFGAGPATPEASVAPGVDWLIVGEAPGENEDRAGEPFVGQAGKLLDNMLSAIQLQRGSSDAPRAGLSNRVFIANVLKCRPPANRNPEPAEIAQCEPYLKRQVGLLKPKVIVAMGKFAAQSLLDASVPDVQKTPLGRLRGRAYDYQGVPVVVTYHPAYLLRSLPDKAKAWDDLCLAMDVFAKAS
ncbi:MAG: uracil-DNA glycosylase [Comamonadaceae bacterium]|nr:MAG: uracil-DNA glycosylase [Comamonadaceae bacterium]